MAAASARMSSPLARPALRAWRAWVLPLGLLLMAEVLLRWRPMQSDAIALPSAVALALAGALGNGSLWVATGQTLAAMLGGLLAGGALGLVVGTWFGLYRSVASRGALLVELLRPLPAVALIPVAMLVFGFGYRLEIFVVGFSVFFLMLVLSRSAVQAVPARLIEVGRMLRLTLAARVGKIVLPAALPRLFVALRLCIGIALVVAVTTEIASNPQGLGYALLSAQQSLAPDLMLAVLVWVGLLGWGVNAGLLALQQRWFGGMAAAGAGA